MKNASSRSAIPQNIFEWAQGVACTIIIFVFIFTLLFRFVGVDGPSMTPTLNDGDRLIINRLFYEPAVGDIVVISRDFAYGGSVNDPMIKRIIAIGGQEVYIDDAGRVFVDGNFFEENYILTNDIFLFGDFSYPLYIPEGYVFVLGDNRNNSLDSRFKEIGLVDTRAILGNAVIRFMPLNYFGTV